MPNRYVRASAIESEAVNSLKWDAEVFWRRLLNRADDFGRFTANPQLLRAAIFPLQLDRVRDSDIPRLLAECEKAGLLFVYLVAAKQYLVLNKWEKGRAKESEYPPPPPDVRERMLAHVYISKHMSPTPIPTPIPITDTDPDLTERGAGEPASTSGPPPSVVAELPLGPIASNPETDPVAMTFPATGKIAEWPLRASKIAEWRVAFPGVAVEAVLRELRQWCIDNPRRRKTANGMLRFLSGRLAARQDRAGGDDGKRGRRMSFA